MKRGAISLAAVVDMPIDRIVIGPRRREKLGRIKVLANSIAAHGLIHPVLLRGEVLIAGHRRIEACRLLKWTTIPARQVERISDDELRAIELDENTARENLSDYATSKARLAEIRQAEADLKAETRSNPEHVSSRPKPKRGPARTPGSKRDVEEATGIPIAEQNRVEQHVEIADRYPFMKRPGWLRHHVLDAGAMIEKIPGADRSTIAALLDQDAIPPGTAITALKHAASMPAVRRREVVRLAQSADPFERRQALTMVGEVPPPPDPGLLALHDAARALARSATDCRSPHFKPRIAEASTGVAALLSEFSAHEREERSNATV